MAKGDGTIKVRGGKIYIHGTVNGKFYRKSTGKKDTKQNLAWVKKQNLLKYLAELVGEVEKENEIKTDLDTFGRNIVNEMTRTVSLKHGKDIESVLEKKILPVFGGMNIEDIKPLEIKQFLEDLKEKMSWTRVKFIKNTFSTIFDYAQENGIIAQNPCKVASIEKMDFSWSPKTEAYTTEEVSIILKNATGWLKIFLELSLKYGLRPGEAMVLKWEDFYLDHGFLRLRRVKNNDGIIEEFSDEELRGKGKKRNKNHNRIIPLFESTVKLLQSYSEVRPHKEWLFITKDQKPFIQSSSIIAYHFKPLLEELDIPYKTLYATRRSYASIMNFSGVDKDKIQEVMGHTKGSRVTDKHYITEDILTANDRKKQAKKNEELFNLFLNNEETPEN